MLHAPPRRLHERLLAAVSGNVRSSRAGIADIVRREAAMGIHYTTENADRGRGSGTGAGGRRRDHVGVPIATWGATRFATAQTATTG